MNTLTKLSFEESKHMDNIRTKVISLYVSVSNMDLDFANLELEELTASLKVLEEIQVKKKRRQDLAKLVSDLKQRGINIDFAVKGIVTVQKNAEELDPAAPTMVL